MPFSKLILTLPHLEWGNKTRNFVIRGARKVFKRVKLKWASDIKFNARDRPIYTENQLSPQASQCCFIKITKPSESPLGPGIICWILPQKIIQIDGIGDIHILLRTIKLVKEYLSMTESVVLTWSVSTIVGIIRSKIVPVGSWFFSKMLPRKR